jgi:aminoglycoside/choline kinase family phosphotransferase
MRPELEVAIRDQWGEISIEPLAGDASTRRFYRIRPTAGESRIVMDYGESFEEPSGDQRMTQIFQAAALPVPDIVAALPLIGALILEDLGDRMLEDELNRAKISVDHPKMLESAVILASKIVLDGSPQLKAAGRLDAPRLDTARFCFEMEFFLENFVGKHLKMTGDQSELRALLLGLAESAAESSDPVLCHRDYHSRNVMIHGASDLVMVDIQDAQAGPDSYDLASLLFDAYVEIDDSWRAPLIRLFIERIGVELEPFQRRLMTVATQRMIKALGTFSFQIEMKQNRRYESAIPRTMSRLATILPHTEELMPIHRQFERLGIYR